MATCVMANKLKRKRLAETHIVLGKNAMSMNVIDNLVKLPKKSLMYFLESELLIDLQNKRNIANESDEHKSYVSEEKSQNAVTQSLLKKFFCTNEFKMVFEKSVTAEPAKENNLKPFLNPVCYLNFEHAIMAKKLLSSKMKIAEYQLRTPLKLVSWCPNALVDKEWHIFSEQNMRDIIFSSLDDDIDGILIPPHMTSLPVPTNYLHYQITNHLALLTLPVLILRSKIEDYDICLIDDSKKQGCVQLFLSDMFNRMNLNC